MLQELLLTPAFPRAVVVGAALVLTVTYSRRGPMIFLPYAGLLAAMALLLSRYATLPYGARFVAAIGAFIVATVPAYVAVTILAARSRERARQQDKVRPPVPGLTLWDRAWRLSAVFVAGVVVCAGVAYVAA